MQIKIKTFFVTLCRHTYDFSHNNINIKNLVNLLKTKLKGAQPLLRRFQQQFSFKLGGLFWTLCPHFRAETHSLTIIVMKKEIKMSLLSEFYFYFKEILPKLDQSVKMFCSLVGRKKTAAFIYLFILV